MIVNGVDGDVITDRPFDCYSSMSNILGSWAEVGVVPFTRSCLNKFKVRKELGLKVRDLQREDMQLRYDAVVDLFETERGFNPGIFDAASPSAVHVERAATAEQQVEDLLKGGKAAFSASGHWNMCNSRIGNAGVTLRAQKRQLEINEEARLMVVDKKTQANVKALEKCNVLWKSILLMAIC